MSYELEKLNKEHKELKLLWDKLKSEWVKPSDFEDLYRVYPLLTTTAAIARKFIYWDKSLDFPVKVVEPSSLDEVDTSEYYYNNEKSFFNGIEKTVSLSSVAGLILHQKEYGYMDNRKDLGEMSEDVIIYIHIKSDLLCKSCSLANNGKYEENGKNYRKTTSFITYSDCTCGFYVDIDTYLNAIDKIISTKK